MELKIKLLDMGIFPYRATNGSACYDIATPFKIVCMPQSFIKVPLRIAFDIPQSWCIKIYPRSSLLPKYGFMVPTSIIDSDYTDQVHALMYNTLTTETTIPEGSRILQFMLCKVEELELQQVDYIEPKSSRKGGIGSSGQ